jgi:Na+/melibiose symporter-like transporter
LLASIPIFFLAGMLGVVGFPLLYVVSFLIGILTVFFDVAYQAYLPSLVHREQLVDANGKLEASRSTAQVTGPSIAGAVIETITAPMAILLDALSFLGSALSLSRIKHEDVVARKHEHSSVKSDIREGLAVVLGDRRLWSIAGSTGTSNFFSSAIFALFVLYATASLGLTPLSLGLVFSIGSVGALVGVVTAARVAKRIGIGLAIVLSMTISGPGLIGIYLAALVFSVRVSIGDIAVSGSIMVLIIAQLITSWSVVVYNVNQVSLRQAIVPLRLQGRLNATMRFLVWGTLPLGGLVGGILGAAIGIHNTIGIAGLGGSMAFLWVLLSPVRSLKEIPASAE